MLREVLVLLLEILARITGPLLEDRLARMALRLMPDLPRIGGDQWWSLDFEDPAEGGRKKKRRVSVHLKQFGRKVHGTGHIRHRAQDSFAFEGKIRRNVFYGSFQRSDQHVLAGTGTFVLKITAHSREMRGHCLWYDGILDAVWASSYNWKRAEK